MKTNPFSISALCDSTRAEAAATKGKSIQWMEEKFGDTEQTTRQLTIACPEFEGSNGTHREREQLT